MANILFILLTDRLMFSSRTGSFNFEAVCLHCEIDSVRLGVGPDLSVRCYYIAHLLIIYPYYIPHGFRTARYPMHFNFSEILQLNKFKAYKLLKIT